MDSMFYFSCTYWNNGAPQTQTSYVDDILITNETPNNTDEFGNPMIGAPAIAPSLDGDFDGDDDTDGADFMLWQRDSSVGSLPDWEANFGMTAALAATTTVPEPSGLVLIGSGIMVCCNRSCR